MEVIYHPRVRAEVLQALRYYTKVSARLADEFHDELKTVVARAAENPQRYHFSERGFAGPICRAFRITFSTRFS